MTGLIDQIVGVLTERMNACPDKDGREYATLVCAIDNFKRAIRTQNPDDREEYLQRAVHFIAEAA